MTEAPDRPTAAPAQPARGEPPAHLRNALRAAAAARARTARIRATRYVAEPAWPIRAEPPASAAPAPVPPAKPPQLSAAGERFSRTAAAASQAQHVNASQLLEANWESCARPAAEAEAKAARWWLRLRKARRAPRRLPRAARAAAPAAIPPPPDLPWLAQRESRQRTGELPDSALDRLPPDWSWLGEPPDADADPIRPPAPAASRQLALLPVSRLPAARLHEALARPAPPPRDDASSGARQRTTRAAANAAARPARARPGARLLIIACALVGGFGLGIVANGGALLTGSKLGEVVLALDGGLFDRQRDAPAAPLPKQKSEPQGGIGGSAPAAELPAPGARAGADDERRPVPARPAAARRLLSVPPTQSYDARAGNSAVVRGSSAAGRAAPATAEPPAGPAADDVSWETLYAQGHRLQLTGNLVAAADAYRRAIRLNPNHPAMLYDLGYVLQMQGEIDAAIDLYRRTIAQRPDHAYAQYNLGYLLLGRGDSESANRHFALAAARQPDNPYIYYDWAWSLETSGDPAGAAALYRKAIEIDPDRRPGLDARRRLAALTGPR